MRLCCYARHAAIVLLGLAIGCEARTGRAERQVAPALYERQANAIVSPGGTASFTPSVSGSSASASASATPLGGRAMFGLGTQAMQKNSIYIGVLPDWSREGPIQVNRALGKAVAIVGDYINCGLPTPSFAQMRYHSADVISLRGSSVYAPAILPNFSLEQWTDAMSASLAQSCLALNQQGVTIWLRPFYEMNGDWMAYGLQPTPFIAAFRSVSQAVRAVTNSTYLVFAPNVAGGSVDGLQGYSQYDPGSAYYDLAGLSFYFAGQDNTQNTVPPVGTFSGGFQPFYDMFASKVPVIVTESSAPYHYQLPASLSQAGIDNGINGAIPNLTTLTPASGGATELAVKSDWVQQMVGPATAGRFPRLIAVSWFDYFKSSGYETNGTQLLDYRLADGDSQVEQFFRTYLGNVTAYQGGYDGSASSARPLLGLVFVAASALVVALLA